jgi:hypothetical protein
MTKSSSLAMCASGMDFMSSRSIALDLQRKAVMMMRDEM